MAEKLPMLALSPTMEEGIIANWLKKEGDKISSGDVICQIETDKATMDYETTAEGVILKIVVHEGEKAMVGDTIAIVGAKDENITSVLEEPQNAKPAKPSEMPPEKTGSIDREYDKNARESETENRKEQIKASPLAKNIARQHGIDLSLIRGTGPEGRIVKTDIEKYMKEKTGAPVSGISPVLKDQVVELSGKRKIIAERMTESMFSAPHFYLKIKINAGSMLNARNKLNAPLDDKNKISLNAFLIKFTAEAIKKHPVINSSLKGDTLTLHANIDIGIAVELKDGLITPVVRNCAGKGIIQIDRELKQLIEKARNNTIRNDEFTGATFTISNLGSYAIDEFSAIINPPGSAILAIGKISKEPVISEDNSIEIQSVMRVTLSCDHRVIDGATGAKFLAELKNIIENPVNALL